MAVFEAMRENTKVILWITVIAFVGLIFLAWGADFSTRSKTGPETGILGRVNGEPIDSRAYSLVLEQSRQTYEAQTGRRLDDAAYVELQATTWDRIIDRILMHQVAERHGILVTEQEVANAMLYSPLPRLRAGEVFRNEQGEFDFSRYQRWLADPRTNTLPLEIEYRELLTVQKLRLLMLSAVKVSDEEVRTRWLGENEKVTIGYTQLPFYQIRTEQNPTDEELEAYMRANAEDYEQPAQVALDYVKLSKVPTAEDTLRARTEIEEARRELDRGEDFILVVQAYSEAPRSRWGGEGAIYWTEEDLAPPKVRTAAFELGVGEVSETIQSRRGFHILRVEDRITEEETEKVKIAEIFLPIEVSYETINVLRDMALDLVDSTGTASFREAAEAAGIEVLSTGAFDPEGFVPGLGNLAPAKTFAGQAQVGQTSRPILTTDAWYVLHLSDQIPAQLPALAGIRRRVRDRYQIELRRTLAEQRAEAILAQCRQGLSLEEASASDSAAVYQVVADVIRRGAVRGLGYDPNLNVFCFQSHEPGLVPRVLTGNQATFLVEILSPPSYDAEAFEAGKSELAAQILQEKQNLAGNEWMASLREQATIEDYRPVIVSL